MANVTGKFGINWFDTSFLRLMDDEVDRNLRKAGIFVVNEVKRDLSTQGSKTSESATQKHSSPGDPPFRQTGQLRRSIARERVGAEERVGSNIKYARFLELGTLNMSPRPFLRPAVIRNRRKIANIILKGLSK